MSKSFGQNRVLDGLDLDIPSGQRVSIIGSSGSGKTTLLRVIMTLEALDRGTIKVFGEFLGQRVVKGELVPDTPERMRKVRSSIGMVFQQFNLFPHMTALGNVIEAPVHVRGASAEEARAEGMELLAMVGLADKAQSYPRQLSGGQQQRVAIARALAMKPRILLFDEVTSALDPERVGEVLGVVRRLAERGDITMVIVTHEMGFAREIADRSIFMEHGRIVEDGPPGKLFTDPQQPRTREFLRSVLRP